MRKILIVLRFYNISKDDNGVRCDLLHVTISHLRRMTTNIDPAIMD